MTMTIFPPSSPPRNRRRLRKKSRPPRLYNNVFEIVEDFRDKSGSGWERSGSGLVLSRLMGAVVLLIMM
jgi:hypothetical protein